MHLALNPENGRCEDIEADNWSKKPFAELSKDAKAVAGFSAFR